MGEEAGVRGGYPGGKLSTVQKFSQKTGHETRVEARLYMMQLRQGLDPS